MLNTKTPATRSFREAFQAGWNLLLPRERTRGAWLAAAQVVEGLLDTLAVGAALPLAGLLVQPDVIETNATLRRFHEMLGSPAYGTLVTSLALAAIALVGAKAILSGLLQWRVQRYGAACQKRLAGELFAEAVNAPYPWFLTRNASRLSLFQDDVISWNRGFVQRLMGITREAITVLLGAVMLLVIAPVLGLVVLAGLGGSAFALLSIVRPRVARLARQKRVAMEHTLLTSTQALTGVKDVKLSSRESYFVRLFENAFGEASDTHARLNVWHLVAPLTLPLVGLVGLMGLVFVQLQLGNTRGEIAAQTALLLLVTSRVVPAVSQLSTSVSSLWNAFPHVQAIHDLRQSVAQAAKSVPAAATADATWNGTWREVSLSGVGFTYPGAATSALCDVGLVLTAGRAYGLAGPSGAGKSTLVDLLLRLLEPTEGSLKVDSRPLAALDVRAWQAGLGYVPQSPFIADDTLRGNVAFGLARHDVDDARVRDCLHLAHLDDLLAELPHGLDAPLGDRGLRVSGGQRQRIAIARALYKRPRLLVLDEATSALDRISEGVIQEAIDGLRGHVTTVTIAHRLATIERCDTIFLLESGRLVAQGRYAELLAQSALFRRMAEGHAPDAVLAHGG
jgi:ATP-binding cassette, subfamily B, bacterial PglK